MVILGGFRFCNAYLKTLGTRFNSITYLTNRNQIILVQPVYCCSYYTGIVSNMISQVFLLVNVCSSTVIKTAF